MSYITVEVQIEQGRIIASEPEKLPKNGTALLTILNVNPSDHQSPSSKSSPPFFNSTASLHEIAAINADTWEKLGPAPEVDYDKL
jgi:hypothetical protein